MRKLFIKFAAIWVLLAINAVAVAAEDVEGARNTVLQVVSDFKTKVVDHREELANNPQGLQSVMREILMPVVDFDDLAKKVMGKYYRRATEAQVETFVTITEETLFRTYGAAVIDFDPSKLSVLPLARQKPGKEVRVDAEFKLTDGSPVTIAFYMVPKETDGWRLNNIVINNINFGLTFRKQFGVMMQQNSNDMEQAIKAWQDSLASSSEES